MLDQSLNYIDDLESLSIIKDGVYKDTYFCVYKGKRAILSQYRLDTNPYNLDPKREVNLLDNIKELELGPDAIFYDEKLNIIITSEIQIKDIDQSKGRDYLLSGLAKSLESLHSFKDVSYRHTFRDSLIFYGDHMKDHKEKNIFNKTIELYDYLCDRNERNCLCHNDLHPENVLISDTIQLIDWEYASLNFPYFDLAYAIEYFEMSEKEILYFMSEYGIVNHDIDIETLNKSKKLTKFITLIWLLILDKYYTIKPSEAKLLTSLITELNV